MGEKIGDGELLGMRNFLPRYEGVFSGGVSIGQRGVVLSDGKMFNTPYTEKTRR